MYIGDLPLICQQRLKDFTENEKTAYLEEYNRKKKSVFIAYCLLIPLGWHYAYLKKWGLQALCILTLWGFLIWYFIDWFRIPSLVRNYNKDLAVSLLNNFNWIENKSSKHLQTESENNNLAEWKIKNPNLTMNEYFRQNKR